MPRVERGQFQVAGLREADSVNRILMESHGYVMLICGWTQMIYNNSQQIHDLIYTTLSKVLRDSKHETSSQSPRNQSDIISCMGPPREILSKKPAQGHLISREPNVREHLVSEIQIWVEQRASLLDLLGARSY